HNPGATAYPWMSWSNAACPSAPDTEFYLPGGEVRRHGPKLATIDWQQSGPRRESDITEMTGYFWKTKDANAFGAFTASLGTGLYHIADEAIAPGMKLWSYGVGKDRVWATLSSARDAPYVEIQGGPMRDQSIKLELQPQEARSHVEFWIPANKALDIYSLQLPNVELRPIDEVTLFDWAREYVVKALLARVLKLDGDIEGAAQALGSIQEQWLQLHPQIIVERDDVLRSSGTRTLAEREQWLNRVDALHDEWIIERRVQLLIDKGE